MRCARHGDAGEPVEGQCRRCLKERVIEWLTELARKGEDPGGKEGESLFALVPKLDLWASELPWLRDGSVATGRAQGFRALLARAYVRAAEARTRGGSPVQALLHLGSATSFEPEDPAVEWEIHYHTAVALGEILRSRGEFGPGQTSIAALRLHASVACHLTVALRHRARVGRATDTADADQVSHARRLLQEILDLGYFQLTENLVIGETTVGERALGVGLMDTFLFPSVPRGGG